MLSAGLRVLVGPLVFIVPAATVVVCGATVATVAVLGDVLASLLGTSACGVLREGSPAVVVGGDGPTVTGPDDGGGVRELEVTLPVVPSLVVRVLVFVHCVVISAVTLVKFGLAAQVPVVGVTGAGGTVAVLGPVSLVTLWFTALGHTLVASSSSVTLWLLDKGMEEIQTSTRAVHILLASWKQGWWSLSQPALQAVHSCLLLGPGIRGICSVQTGRPG